MTDAEFVKEYESLGHAIQSGIAWKLALEHPECPDVNSDVNLCEHKHMRVGIDTSKADMGALVRLLIAKGVITDDEYKAAMLDGLKREKELYEHMLSVAFKAEIKLG